MKVAVFLALALVFCAAVDSASAVCACGRDYVPVCGADGATYSNACMAGCAGVEVAAPGSCPAK